MNNLMNLQFSITFVLLSIFATISINAQSSYLESFNVGKDALVSVNTSHTNVIFETWDKNKIEVEAFIDDDKLSKEEKEIIFDKWKLEVLGNSKKVVINSNEGSLWGGIESLGSLKALKRLESLESLSGLKALEALGDMPLFEGFKDMDWNVVVPDIPEHKEFPDWPFSSNQPNFKNGDVYNNYRKGNNIVFDRSKYEKNKQEYVNKLNKKYKSNVSVAQTDAWLSEVDAWTQEIEITMEKWGEDFGKEFENNFGPEFERKMEKWGEEFGKKMEKWGEEFGEKFEKEMEEWGEKFGKDMEKWGEQLEKDAEKWAEQFEDEEGTTIIIDRDKNNLFEKSLKAKKTIIIRMPKGTKTDINVRHGEVKMADIYNLKADLNYSALTANSIDGGETLINASYAPVMINNWKKGELSLNYVEDCRLNKVEEINLHANSSDVNINSLENEAFLLGSFGYLFIKEVSNNFNNLDITIENANSKINIPTSAFTFYYNGRKSALENKTSLHFDTNSKTKDQTILRGYNKDKNNDKSITINASYSSIVLQ